ncbi:VOC family protein [Marinicrinis lubricantis]|uniref:VOC family protein n=1 Tax=Marinicrinis lubricantis TaxID=2086470 RepID=A0ABW1IQ04_9BACL
MAVKAGHIFVNLPVKDLQQTKEFFKAIGFEFNPQFTDENAACLVINDNIFAMLLTEPFFKGFMKKEVCNTSSHAEVIIALSAESREQVDEWADRALKAGGKQASDPADHGFMYTRSFEDLDGHIWEISYMDMSAVPQE